MLKDHIVIFSITFFSAAVIGIVLGLALAGIANFESMAEMNPWESALPTKIYDINGELITEFFSDEKRSIVPFEEIPEHLIFALLAREDQEFYTHPGFSIKHILRAAIGYLSGNYEGGGSTLTIQVAGRRHADRTEFTIWRKLVELWFALLYEKYYAKNEIMEFYLNEMFFGYGYYGIEAASQYYFNKSARDITLAESVILVNILNLPAYRDPLVNPSIARELCLHVLNEMVDLGYTTQEEADKSYGDYWNNYDYTRLRGETAFFEREDKAPWFSEYIREELQRMLKGNYDIYKDGLKVYTTLDLRIQRIADDVMEKAIDQANENYRNQLYPRYKYIEYEIFPTLNILASVYNIPQLRPSYQSINRMKALRMYHEELNPVIDLLAKCFNTNTLMEPIGTSYEEKMEILGKTQVEGALICIDSKTGYIYAVVGGSEFNPYNQFNRAIYGKMQPGSSFKPLYYSAAIESGIFTAGSLLIDRWTAFDKGDGTLYIPTNYIGHWYGRKLVRDCLSLSLNVPSLKVLNTIGFDRAIDTASQLFGITDPEEIDKTFPRVLPLGLGTVSISPMQMARAFATFVNSGRAVEPIAILYVEDRLGNRILEPAKDSLERQKLPESQILSPQTAYIMTNILQSVVQWGTLRYGTNNIGGFDGRPMGGKTGTTQNWSDGWAIGFSNQLTASLWFGFDQPGNSLGRYQAGANVAGFPWAEFMKRVHDELELPIEEFPEPVDGLIWVPICKKSGLLPDPDGACGDEVRLEVFVKGTEPTQFCNYHKKDNLIKEETEEKLKNKYLYNLQTELTRSDLNIPPLFDKEQIFNEEEINLDAVEPDKEEGEREKDTEIEPVESEGNPFLDE